MHLYFRTFIGDPIPYDPDLSAEELTLNVSMDVIDCLCVLFAL